MQKSKDFNSLKNNFYNIVSSQKILNELEANIGRIKDSYEAFYKNNIGAIDKIESTHLDKYILRQDSNPLGTCTIKLDKNLYVMQKDFNDGNYSYLVFKKNSSPMLPYKDDMAMADIESRYSVATPLRKKGLLEKIYEKHEDILKENKITKKYFFGTKISELSPELEKIGIQDLTEAMNYYNIRNSERATLKRVTDIDIQTQSEFYQEYQNINTRLDDMSESELMLYYSELKNKIKERVKELKTELVKEDKNEDFITKTSYEDLECVSIPKAPYIQEAFFGKKLDMSAINYDIYKGKLDFEKKIDFTFYQPSRTLADLVDRLNSLDYVKNITKNSDIEHYEKYEAIALN